jgi:hypothetical protein
VAAIVAGSIRKGEASTHNTSRETFAPRSDIQMLVEQLDGQACAERVNWHSGTVDAMQDDVGAPNEMVGLDCASLSQPPEGQRLGIMSEAAASDTQEGAQREGVKTKRKSVKAARSRKCNRS